MPPLREEKRGRQPRRFRTMMHYDRGRGPLDRHATCIVATFLAGASSQADDGAGGTGRR